MWRFPAPRSLEEALGAVEKSVLSNVIAPGVDVIENEESDAEKKPCRVVVRRSAVVRFVRDARSARHVMVTAAGALALASCVGG